MWTRFQKLPLAISIPTLFIAMLMIPSLHGFISGDSHKGRIFFYAVLLGLFGLTFLRFSLQGAVFPMHRHAQLWSLIAFFLGFPMLLAIPLYEVIGTGQFIDAYLDIVSTVTTTGLPIFAPGSLTETLIIWRVSLGWASGFLIWVFAWSVFAPLNLGGFEHLGARGETMNQSQGARQTVGRLPAEKFWREALRLGPVYLWITLAAALALLLVSGDPSYAMLRAMATIATFGIEIPGHSGAGGVPGEAILAVVMLFALSRSTFSTVFARARKWRVTEDPELRVAAGLVLVATLVLIGHGAHSVADLGARLELIMGRVFYKPVISDHNGAGVRVSAFWTIKLGSGGNHPCCFGNDWGRRGDDGGGHKTLARIHFGRSQPRRGQSPHCALTGYVGTAGKPLARSSQCDVGLRVFGAVHFGSGGDHLGSDGHGQPGEGSLAPHIGNSHQHGTAFAEWCWLSDTGYVTPNRGKIDFGGGNGSGPA